MIARVAIHSHRVGNIITIKRYGIITDRRSKRELQQSHVVVVDIHVSEHILDSDIQDIARLEKLVHALAGLSHHDMSFTLRILPVEMAGHCLIDVQRQNVLLIIG